MEYFKGEVIVMPKTREIKLKLYLHIFIEFVTILLLSLQYYPQSWMLQYLDVAVNLVDQSVGLSSIYLAKDCGDDYGVKFWWYGSKTICYEYGDVKYETCSEDSTGVEISGFMPTVIEKIQKD